MFNKQRVYRDYELWRTASFKLLTTLMRGYKHIKKGGRGTVLGSEKVNIRLLQKHQIDSHKRLMLSNIKIREEEVFKLDFDTHNGKLCTKGGRTLIVSGYALNHTYVSIIFFIP